MPSSWVLADGRVLVGSGWAASLGSVSPDVSPRTGLDEEPPAEDGWMDDGWPGWQGQVAGGPRVRWGSAPVSRGAGA